VDVAPRLRGATLLFAVSLLAPGVTARAQQAPPSACREPLAAPLPAACRLLAEQPDRYASLPRRSREGPEAIASGVASLVGERIDLEPLLSGLRPIRYRIRVQPVSPPHAAPAPGFQVIIDGSANQWRGEWQASTGLFRLTIAPMVPAGAPLIGSEAWVLVDEGRFAQTSADFARLGAQLDAVRGLSDEDRELLIRAALDDIASRPR
jgi:hypothetical protein